MSKTERLKPAVLAAISWEGDSKEVLSSWSADIKTDFGFSLREMQQGRPPRLENKPINSIGPKVFELKDYDDEKDYRLIYVARIDDVIYVLHCFEKTSQKTKQRDLNLAETRLKDVLQRLRGNYAKLKKRNQ